MHFDRKKIVSKVCQETLCAPNSIPLLYPVKNKSLISLRSWWTDSVNIIHINEQRLQLLLFLNQPQPGASCVLRLQTAEVPISDYAD